MCYQGVWFVGKSATGPWEVAELGAAADLPDPGQLSRASRDLRDRRRQTTTTTGSSFAAAAGYTGMMVAWGCTVWGIGLVLPAVLGLRRLLSVLLPALPDLRILGLVQPVDRRLRAQRGGLRSVRRRRRRRPLQPAHRHLRARRGGVRAVRRARRRAGLQPAHRHLRGDAPGIERVRQLGIDGRAARRRLGQDQSLHEPTDRDHDAHGQDRRGRRGHAARRRGGFVGAGSGGNVYAGNDGNVYRRQDGTWQKYDNGGWSNTDRQPSGERPQPTDRTARGERATTMDRGTTDQLNRDAAARREGTQRAKDYGNYRSGSGTPRHRQLSRRRRFPRRRRPEALNEGRRNSCV